MAERSGVVKKDLDWYGCMADTHAENYLREAVRERDEALRVQSAALAWWRAHRPVGWTREEHLREPTVNTLTDREKRLARTVAALAKVEKKEKP